MKEVLVDLGIIVGDMKIRFNIDNPGEAERFSAFLRGYGQCAIDMDMNRDEVCRLVEKKAQERPDLVSAVIRN